MSDSRISMVAVAWLRPEEWDDLKRVCDGLQDTYDEWLADAEAGVAAYRKIGHEPIKVVLTLDELRQRKRATGRKVDSKTRAAMAAIKAHDKHGTRH